MIRILTFSFFFLPFVLMAQTTTQTLRGQVLDAHTLKPLVSATVSLPDAQESTGVVTNEEGWYVFSEVPIGRYRVQANYLGYGSLTIAEVQVEAGRETVQNIHLWEQAEELGEVVVRAQSNENLSHPASLHTLTVEDQFRYPATFFDPARVVTIYPGVAAPNDQANHLSIRGNSPNAVRWRLEGADIVNPNHTANAGTFSDRPSSAGGGVSILSSQVLDASNFLTGAFPVGYGNSIGGVMDMRFRKGNDQRRQYVAQAGVIGLELAAEGPLGSQQSVAGNGQPSFLLNYRYSFTGLLTSFGVDFGGEEIGFQDLSFRLNFPTEKAGEFSVFGLGGASENIFTSPRENITEEKEWYDIDFESKMGAIGLTHVLPTGRNSLWRTTVALSALEHERVSERVVEVSTPFIWDRDEITERKLSINSTFSNKTSGGGQFRAGVLINQEQNEFLVFANDNLGGTELMGEVDGWLLQPFAEWQKRMSARWEFTAGLHLAHYTFSEKTNVEPRVSLSYFTSKKGRLYLASGFHSQSQLPQVQALSENSKVVPTRSQHTVLGFSKNLKRGRQLTIELYHQHLFDVPVSTGEEEVFSVLNLTEFTDFVGVDLSGQGTGRNYGIDLFFQKFWKGGRFATASTSLYRSRFAGVDGEEHSTRWDGGYLINISSGRERVKLNKKGKTRTWGNSFHLMWMGGFRERPINPALSMELGRTTYQFPSDFSRRLSDYYRLDLRTYLKWESPKGSSLLSLDIQNLTSRENEAFRYFDQSTMSVRMRKQLGFIPVISWRKGF